jgi:hypothetical protein
MVTGIPRALECEPEERGSPADKFVRLEIFSTSQVALLGQAR